jgi:LytTr DNA-binding domain-containing protein
MNGKGKITIINSFAEEILSVMWLKIVNEPFPMYTWRPYWLRGAGFGVFVFLFLFLFRPFRLDLYPPVRLLYTTAVYGLITGTVIFAGSFLLIKLIGPFIKEERWTLGKQILWNTFLMVCIALLNVFVTQFMLNVPIPLSWYFKMLIWVFMLGIFPIAIAELLTYNHYLRRHVKKASEMSELMLKSNTTENIAQQSVPFLTMSLKEEEVLDAEPATKNFGLPPNVADLASGDLLLTGENLGDNLEIPGDKLLAVQALDNYVNIFWELNGVLQTTMLRNTLTNIARQVSDLPYLYRTHRGWLVNTKRVIQVEGNAQGLKLLVPLLKQRVPVSRANIAGYRSIAESGNAVTMLA